VSRHIPRHERWSKRGPNEYTSGDGAVRFERGAWWAWVAYRQLPPEHSLPAPPEAWEEHADRLGPFKRPRNAMMAAEAHALILQRRYGDHVHFETPPVNAKSARD
jgi:hypothetical protein